MPTELTPTPPNWATVISALTAGAAFVLGVVAWFRAGRAARLAERAELRAIAADDRAEEAHTILKARAVSEQEREAATLEAPEICERWVADLNRATETARLARRYNAAIQVRVATLGERLALNVLRERRDALSIREISVAGGVASISRVWRPGVKLLM